MKTGELGLLECGEVQLLGSIGSSSFPDFLVVVGLVSPGPIPAIELRRDEGESTSSILRNIGGGVAVLVGLNFVAGLEERLMSRSRAARTWRFSSSRRASMLRGGRDCDD